MRATVKKVSLELGGNAPFIVFDDADLDAAVDGAMPSKFRNTGQPASAPTGFYVHESLYDSLPQSSQRAPASLRSGTASRRRRAQGPLINEEAVREGGMAHRGCPAKGARS